MTSWAPSKYRSTFLGSNIGDRLDEYLSSGNFVFGLVIGGVTGIGTFRSSVGREHRIEYLAVAGVLAGILSLALKDKNVLIGTVAGFVPGAIAGWISSKISA